MALSPKTEALIGRSLVGLSLVEIPVVTFQLSQPVFDYKLLAVGLLGALAGFLDKQFSPQLANVILPDTKVSAPEAPPSPPTVADLRAMIAQMKQEQADRDALFSQLAELGRPASAAPPATMPPSPSTLSAVMPPPVTAP